MAIPPQRHPRHPVGQAPAVEVEGLVPDVVVNHRPGAGAITRIAVHWSPNGFIVQVERVPLVNGQGYVEDNRSLTVKLPWTKRRNRKNV